jgi:voltage-gated potassium channel
VPSFRELLSAGPAKLIRTMGRTEKQRTDLARGEILETLENWLETPLLILGIVWLILLIVELIWGFSPWLATASDVIWIIFIIDFAIKFILAPKKLEYLKKNWLTAISLAVPALRVFRIFRIIRILKAARVARGLRLFRVLTSVNRGLKAIGASFGRKGLPYVLGATTIVLFAGAAGMYAFEYNVSGTGIDSYGSAVWWTAMMITSIGSDYFPKSAEGRFLCFLIGLYGFVVFGYLTAALASFFVEREGVTGKKAASSPKPALDRIESELEKIREEIRMLDQRLSS